MSESQTALITFLQKALKKKRSRVIGFATSKHTKKKFLDLIYHELEDLLGEDKAITELPEKVLRSPVYVFEPPDTFGHKAPSMRDVYDSSDDSWLAVTEDGVYAVHSPETRLDDRTIYQINVETRV